MVGKPTRGRLAYLSQGLKTGGFAPRTPQEVRTQILDARFRRWRDLPAVRVLWTGSSCEN